MRKVSITLSVFVLLAMLLTACGGQQTSTTVPATVPPATVESTATSAPEMTTTAGVPVTGAQNPLRLSNELKFSIVDQSGNKLGDVSDMVLDLENTRVSYVVTGSGSSSVLIPWDSLKLQTSSSSTTTSSAQNAFVLQADPQVFQNAPKTDLSSVLPAVGTAANNWDADIQNYWLSGGSTSTSTGTPSAGAGTATQAPAVSSTSTSTSGANTGTATETPSVSATSTSTSGTGTGTSRAMSLQGFVLASKVIGATISLGMSAGGQSSSTAVATSSSGGTGTATETPSANATSTSTSETGGAAASTATSTSGGSSTGSGTGASATLQATISDMIVEASTGLLQYVIVKADFGSGAVLIPVPLNLIQWDATNNAFVINTSSSVLQGAPNFTEDQFPDTSTSGWDQQFSTYWSSNGGSSTGTGTGSGSGAGTGATATATP